MATIDRNVESFELVLGASTSRVKVVNSEARVINRSAQSDFTVGSWTGKLTLLTVPIDDFDIILMMDFL